MVLAIRCIKPTLFYYLSLKSKMRVNLFNHRHIIFQHEDSVGFQVIPNPGFFFLAINQFAQSLHYLVVFDFLNESETISQVFSCGFTSSFFNYFSIDIPIVLSKIINIVDISHGNFISQSQG